MAVLQKFQSLRAAGKKVYLFSVYASVMAIVLVVIMILSWTLPALAESRNGIYILDEKEYLTEAEWQAYQAQAKELSDRLNMDILYVQTYHKDLQTDAQSLNLGSRSNQIMLLDNDGVCDIALFGTANVLTQEHIGQLRNAYIVKPTYTEGVAAYLAAAEQIVTDLNNSGAFAPKSDVPISQAQIVSSDDVEHLAEKSPSFGKWLLISLMVGLLAAGAVVWYIMKQRKTLEKMRTE